MIAENVISLHSSKKFKIIHMMVSSVSSSLDSVRVLTGRMGRILVSHFMKCIALVMIWVWNVVKRILLCCCYSGNILFYFQASCFCPLPNRCYCRDRQKPWTWDFYSCYIVILEGMHVDLSFCAVLDFVNLCLWIGRESSSLPHVE